VVAVSTGGVDVELMAVALSSTGRKTKTSSVVSKKKYKRSGKWYRVLVGWFLGRVGMGFGRINSSLLFFSVKFSFLFSVSGLFAGFLLLWLLME
jgi:hypothetical protein